MNRLSTAPQEPRPTLQAILRRAHLRTVLISVFLIGLSSIAIAVVALRIYTINNLELVAQSIGYTVEAAVVFGDREAAADSLAAISSNYSVANADIVDTKGADFASWRRFDDPSETRTEQVLAALILPQPVVGRITHDGKQIGEVRLVGYGRDLLLLLSFSIGGALFCFLLSSLAAYFLSRRAGQEIIAPIHEIARIAHAARRERQFSRRVRAGRIEELHRLGNDVNALLADLDSWQAQEKLEKATLAYRSDHDSLTDLHNRAYFESRLEMAIDSARQADSALAVLFIDSDNFKTINDEFGHDVGDEVLRTTGLRLRAQLREADLVARFGGDEFAILINPIRESGDATRIAEKILASMKEPISLMDGSTLQSSLSIGIAFFPDHADEPDALIKCADSAMYRAKRLCRATYQVAPECAHS